MGAINFVKVQRRDLQDPGSADRTYAQSQTRQTLGIKALAKHMADHNCPHPYRRRHTAARSLQPASSL